jgi:hypothetical protein
MNRGQPKETPAERLDADRPADDPKHRRCLKCGDDFPSEWAGQRVCPRCKKRSEWRSGAPPRSY